MPVKSAKHPSEKILAVSQASGWLVLVFLLLVDRILWTLRTPENTEPINNVVMGTSGGNLSNLVHWGLVSSSTLPNPNGMPLVGLALGWTTYMFVFHALIGCLQCLLVYLVCREVAERKLPFFAILLPILTAVPSRGVSVEFVNSYFLTSLNLFVVWCLLFYLRTSIKWALSFVVAAAVFAPGLYIGGVANAVTYSLFTLFVFLWGPSRGSWKNWVGPGLLSILLVGFFIWNIWVPYFQEISIWEAIEVGRRNRYQTIGVSDNSELGNPLANALKSIVTFPRWIIYQWLPDYFPLFVPPHFAPYQPATWLPSVDGYIRIVYRTQAVLFLASLGICAGFAYLAKVKGFLPKLAASQGVRQKSLLVVWAFLITIYAVCPLLGGPKWGSMQRSDGAIQFLPFFLILLFGSAWAVPLPGKLSSYFQKITAALSAAYVILNVIAGAGLIDLYWKKREEVPYSKTFRLRFDSEGSNNTYNTRAIYDAHQKLQREEMEKKKAEGK